MHFQMAAMYILKGTIKCNVINHGIAQMMMMMLVVVVVVVMLMIMVNIFLNY